ncbi:uncharacterized protein BDR25DRAFT_355993 [Lindgomyces ingoldianus]|uniref:Uncharacterized protein n=1 Tax=Lindgomyces ingoldianus TaxID=673940 RepID=A0ACB6QS59_9PLEO|nr:uncharacterized protein BDR25DRAFT_355993 [Lindgomyces ingoldianus]KAF2469736.1 hypothetical protein BDR25DRAFT_355993 [Lindgomyces ingoldianus]
MFMGSWPLPPPRPHLLFIAEELARSHRSLAGWRGSVTADTQKATPAIASMADDPSLINLKILSPSTEVDGDINVPDLPASTTVSELKLRIRNEISTHPAVERMRLIYRGRVVANETDTMIDVFGMEQIRNSKDQSLHLVLRELPTTTSPAPRSSTAPPNPFRPLQTPASPPANPHTNPFRAQPQPRPNSQPQLPHPHHLHHHHHHAHAHAHPQGPFPFNGIPLPPNMNDMFQQQVAQAMGRNVHQNPAQDAQNQPSHSPGGTPAPADGTQAAAGGMPPAMGPGTPNFAPNTTRTIRHETIGPNGERWTMTINNTNLTIPAQPHQHPILPRPFPHPSRFPSPVRPPGSLGNSIDNELSQVRIGLQTAQQEMENVRVLLQAPGGHAGSQGLPPPWRHNLIRQHVQNLMQNLDHIQRGLATLIADPILARNRDVLSLQMSSNELRSHAEDLNTMLDRLRDADVPAQTPNAVPSSSAQPSSSPDTVPQAAPPQTQPQSQPQSQASPGPSVTDIGSELFILSSPQGPVGILFDHRGTYSTAPMVSTLPFQTFTQQFSANRQLLAGIGQQIAQNSAQLQNQLAAARPVGNEGGNAADQNQPAAQHQAQPQNQAQNQAQPQNPAENDRLVVIAGHLWLLFKLACFVYIFAGGGGWYRPVMLGIVCALVYLAQVGVFEDQFDRVRRHFEALLPLQLLANERGQGGRGGGNAQGRGAQGGAGDEGVGAGAGGNQNREHTHTPESVAQRLVERHNEERFAWIRRVVGSTERAFALFIASLWPGIGERMVQAQEERVRAEREAAEREAAERERQRLEAEAEEERRKVDEEERIGEGEKGEKVSKDDGDSGMGKGKGKEKLVIVRRRAFSSLSRLLHQGGFCSEESGLKPELHPARPKTTEIADSLRGYIYAVVKIYPEHSKAAKKEKRKKGRIENLEVLFQVSVEIFEVPFSSFFSGRMTVRALAGCRSVGIMLCRVGDWLLLAGTLLRCDLPPSLSLSHFHFWGDVNHLNLNSNLKSGLLILYYDSLTTTSTLNRGDKFKVIPSCLNERKPRQELRARKRRRWTKSKNSFYKGFPLFVRLNVWDCFSSTDSPWYAMYTLSHSACLLVCHAKIQCQVGSIAENANTMPGRIPNRVNERKYNTFEEEEKESSSSSSSSLEGRIRIKRRKGEDDNATIIAFAKACATPKPHGVSRTRGDLKGMAASEMLCDAAQCNAMQCLLGIVLVGGYATKA